MRAIFKFELILLAFLALSTAVFAIANPASTYCVEMGYALAGENCTFDDGNSCEQWAFYRGECGQSYVKGISCANAGERSGVAKKCCAGLIELTASSCDANGICNEIVGGYPLCSNCGNNICEAWENKDNCPADCHTSSIQCINRNGACCLGDMCIMDAVTCVAGAKAVFNGCDSNCKPKWTCETPACAIPKCPNSQKTGEIDQNGCPVYACPTCSMPICKDGGDPVFTGKKDANGCEIYQCNVAACEIPQARNCKPTGNFKSNGCPEYICSACNAPRCQGAYKTGEVDENGCPVIKCPSCENQYYKCPDGKLVDWCVCGENTVSCDAQPEKKCSNCQDNICTANEIYTCKEDCSIYDGKLIVKDIGEWTFVNAVYDKRKADGVNSEFAVFTASYQFRNNMKKVNVMEFGSSDEAKKAFENLIGQKNYKIMTIGKDVVYDFGESIVWISGNRIISVDRRLKLAIAVKARGEGSAPTIQTVTSEKVKAVAITGNAVNEVITTPAEVSVSESPIIAVKEQIAAKELVSYKADEHNLVKAYLGLYPSDITEANNCGNGICEYGEQDSCDLDCGKICPATTPIPEGAKKKCIANNGKWIAGESANGCPVPPYCISEANNEITDLEKLALIMKLEKLSVSLEEMKTNAKSLADFYTKADNLIKGEKWNNAVQVLSDSINKIADAQRQIKDSQDQKEIKQIVKDATSFAKENLKKMLDELTSKEVAQ